MQKAFPVMLGLQTHCYLKLDIQNVYQHTGNKWLIHSTKHHKDNYLPSLLPVILVLQFLTCFPHLCVCA